MQRDDTNFTASCSNVLKIEKLNCLGPFQSQQFITLPNIAGGYGSRLRQAQHLALSVQVSKRVIGRLQDFGNPTVETAGCCGVRY